MQETSCYGFNPPGSKTGLALHSGARNPVSTGSIATQFDAIASSVSRVGRFRKVTAATAIFSLSIRSVRLKHRAVNTKPSSKYFVKLERFEASRAKQSAAQFPFCQSTLRHWSYLHLLDDCSIARQNRGTSLTRVLLGGFLLIAAAVPALAQTSRTEHVVVYGALPDSVEQSGQIDSGGDLPKAAHHRPPASAVLRSRAAGVAPSSSDTDQAASATRIPYSSIRSTGIRSSGPDTLRHPATEPE